MKILHLTLKKQWFDLIASGEKKEEYREIKPYWDVRLNKPYDAVLFRNGYSQNAPTMMFRVNWIDKGAGNPRWGAPFRNVYIISLGERLS